MSVAGLPHPESQTSRVQGTVFPHTCAAWDLFPAALHQGALNPREGEENTQYWTHAVSPGSLILPATHDWLQRCELFSLYEWRAEVQRLSKRVLET